MNKVIAEMTSTNFSDRSQQTSLGRRQSQIVQRVSYGEKRADLRIINRTRESMSKLAQAATAYRTFCEEMLHEGVEGGAGLNMGVWKLMEKVKVAYKEAADDFEEKSEAMVALNMRFFATSKHKLFKDRMNANGITPTKGKPLPDDSDASGGEGDEEGEGVN
jgi:hypothetical protein